MVRSRKNSENNAIHVNLHVRKIPFHATQLRGLPTLNSYEEVGSNLGVDRSTVVSYNWKGKQETISQGICQPPGYFQPLHSCI